MRDSRCRTATLRLLIARVALVFKWINFNSTSIIIYIDRYYCPYTQLSLYDIHNNLCQL